MIEPFSPQRKVRGKYEHLQTFVRRTFAWTTDPSCSLLHVLKKELTTQKWLSFFSSAQKSVSGQKTEEVWTCPKVWIWILSLPGWWLCSRWSRAHAPAGSWTLPREAGTRRWGPARPGPPGRSRWGTRTWWDAGPRWPGPTASRWRNPADTYAFCFYLANGNINQVQGNTRYISTINDQNFFLRLS